MVPAVVADFTIVSNRTSGNDGIGKISPTRLQLAFKNRRLISFDELYKYYRYDGVKSRIERLEYDPWDGLKTAAILAALMALMALGMTVCHLRARSRARRNASSTAARVNECSLPNPPSTSSPTPPPHAPPPPAYQPDFVVVTLALPEDDADCIDEEESDYLADKEDNEVTSRMLPRNNSGS